MQVLPGTFDNYFVSIALQDNSPFRKPVNKALLKFMKTQNWTELAIVICSEAVSESVWVVVLHAAELGQIYFSTFTSN